MECYISSTRTMLRIGYWHYIVKIHLIHSVNTPNTCSKLCATETVNVTSSSSASMLTVWILNFDVI